MKGYKITKNIEKFFTRQKKIYFLKHKFHKIYIYKFAIFYEKEDMAIEIFYSGSPVHTSVITVSVPRLNLALECAPV